MDIVAVADVGGGSEDPHLLLHCDPRVDALLNAQENAAIPVELQ